MRRDYFEDPGADGQIFILLLIHLLTAIGFFHVQSDDRAIASSKASSLQIAIWCFTFQIQLSSPFLKIIHSFLRHLPRVPFI
jgi:hypothetical protein